MSPLRAIAILVAVIASPPALGREFRTSDITAENSPTVEAIKRLGQLLSERTQNRHHIITVGSRDPDSENFIIGEVQNGLLDMARVNLATFNSTVPATVPLSLPFLFKSQAHLRRVLDGPIGAEILASLEERGVVGLCFYDTGPRSIYSVDRLVRHVDDMKGLRIRIQPGDLAPTVVKALGAIATPMPYSRIGEALKSRAIDAADGNWLAYISDGHFRYAKVYNDTEHSRPPGVVIVSRAAWKELSDEDRAILKQAARESVEFMRERYQVYETRARAEAARAGVREIIDVDVKSFADVLRPTYPDLLPGARQRNILDRIQAEQQAAATP
jgi:TRAP-type C4-dicarboxylate transport system substrate-binding protein